jgi:outer membrane protein assembly factor BamB
VGKSLIFSCDGASNPFVAALDAGNGRLLWKTPRDTDARKTFSFATPQWFEAGGREQVAIPGSNRVVAYNPKNGDPIWFARYDGYSVIPRPVFGHGMLFVATGYDRPTVMAIRPGKGDVTGENVEWVVTKRAPHTPSMILAGDDLFWVSDSGQATCADAKTGEVIWQERVCDACSASPVYAEKSGLIYIQDERGKGVVLRAGRKFELVAENDLGERSLASYAAEDGALYIRTAEALYKIAR